MCLPPTYLPAPHLHNTHPAGARKRNRDKRGRKTPKAAMPKQRKIRPDARRILKPQCENPLKQGVFGGLKLFQTCF
jgi:hypothetical protein